jgi:hypothetical protein
MYEKTPRVPISTGEGQTAYKRQLAYDQLGIDPKDVPITPLVAAQMTRIGRLTGYKPALELLAQSDDPEARKVYAAYVSVSRTYRKLISPEAYCFAAGVDPNRMLEAITVVAVRQGTRSATIVASIMNPQVVMKTVEMALQDRGFRERRILLRATGFLQAS